jgi:hypothetical protein
MATAACDLINGVFFLWFDLMETSACGSINGVFFLLFD